MRIADDKKISLDFQEKLPLWMTENHVPTVGIAVIEKGKLKLTKVFGELQKGTIAPKETLFDVCSLTKPIAAMTVLRLVSAGKWDLDEPLFHYWIDNDVKDDMRLKKLTTRFVLSHQTGFPNWRWNTPSKKLSFSFEPGTKYQYSGEGFVYMKRAIEKKLGNSWKDITKDLLFTPLRMKKTRLVWDSSLDRSLLAIPHNEKGDPLKPEFEQELDLTPHRATTLDDIEYHYSPAGSLVTTVEEYGKFAISVLDGAGLSKNIYKEMNTPQRKVFGSLSVGLGWFIINNLSNDQYATVHTGDDPGLRTLVVLLPQSKCGVVVLTNGDNGNEICKHVIKESLSVGGELAKTIVF